MAAWLCRLRASARGFWEFSLALWPESRGRALRGVGKRQGQRLPLGPLGLSVAGPRPLILKHCGLRCLLAVTVAGSSVTCEARVPGGLGPSILSVAPRAGESRGGAGCHGDVSAAFRGARSPTPAAPPRPEALPRAFRSLSVSRGALCLGTASPLPPRCGTCSCGRPRGDRLPLRGSSPRCLFLVLLQSARDPALFSAAALWFPCRSG